MIPFATSFLSVQRQVRLDGELDVDSDTDYSPTLAPWTVIVANLRAVINAGTGGVSYGVMGTETSVRYDFQSDLPPNGAVLQAQDRVVDRDGTSYLVEWSRPVQGLGLVSLEGGLIQVVGADG